MKQIPDLAFRIGIFLAVISSVFSQEKSSCTSKNTCSDCIRTGANCAWCKQEGFDKSARCDLLSNIASVCPPEDLVNPGNALTKNVDKSLSLPNSDQKDVVQLAPQEITIKLRPGSKFSFDVRFRQAEDYPVDLYYLMDLSQTMAAHKDKLAALGAKLAEEMSKITKNFRLGFGSFIDKTVMPYTSTVPEKLISPCASCSAPYGFKHHMALSLDASLFKTEVDKAKVSGNLDSPEGGFDAIMQAMVCDKEIGWRTHSRKLLVFSTDSGFHIAGDGKLGGIVKPNDGRCHLDAKGLYSESNHQDYPSVSQLNQKAIERKMHMIFAVTESQYELYDFLSSHLGGSSTGKLDNDSSNVIDLVKNQYNRISSEVQLNDNATDDVEVAYYSSCLDPSGPLEKTNICEGLKVGNTVSFRVDLFLKRCPKDLKSGPRQKFTISPVGLNEYLTVNLDMICECDCEKPENEERNSPKCSDGNGTYECGVCSCNSNRFGALCQCDAQSATSGASEEASKCIDPNSTSRIECSGRGECLCGACDCSIAKTPPPAGMFTVSGDYCECDDFTCDKHDNKLCGGIDHGKCVCRKCECLPGWTGSACNCRASNETCIAKGSDMVCSGNGDCLCGVCSNCKATNSGRYSGAYCEECPGCNQKCTEFKPCVQCKLNHGSDCSSECQVNTVLVDNVKVRANSSDKLCIKYDDDGCKMSFVYGQDETNAYYIRAQDTKECPAPVNAKLIGGGVTGGIVAIGLGILLLWKLLTTVHDRREFAKFEEERQKAKWDEGENPIYKQATTTFSNPTYGHEDNMAPTK